MGLPGALTPGTIIGRHYIIGDLLNMGGFGAVYRGTDTSEQNRPCAIKETYDVTPSARRQALMEASVLFTVRSPHLPEVYDALEENGRFYLIMQLIEGQNLLQLLRTRVPGGRVGDQAPYQSTSGPCLESEVLHWLLPIIDVLQELHSRRPPVMHRDIKPGNIVLKPDNTAVLVDFGLTKLYDPNVSTQTLGRAVTEGFSPIEQYVGKTTPQSDIYSMAATMYLLLTNRLPPAATKRASVDELLNPRAVNPTLSMKMERILLKALALHAEDRFQCMQDFAQALREPTFDGYNDATVRVPPMIASATPLPLPATMNQPGGNNAPVPPNQPGHGYVPLAPGQPSGAQAPLRLGPQPQPPAYPPGYANPGYVSQPYPAVRPQGYVPGQQQQGMPGAQTPLPPLSPAPYYTPGPYAGGQQQMNYPGAMPSYRASQPGYPHAPGGVQTPQAPVDPRKKGYLAQPFVSRPLPNPSNQGCLWGLFQGLLAAALVFFSHQQTDFYLATIVGFLFYALAGFVTARRGGSLLRGGWAGYWTGIFGTIIFWLSLGLALAVSFIQDLLHITSLVPGINSQDADTQAWNEIKPDWPPVPAFLPQQPALVNFLVLLLLGAVIAWLCGWLGGLLSRMRRTKMFAQH
jgi:serine/threonine protein kinase